MRMRSERILDFGPGFIGEWHGTFVEGLNDLNGAVESIPLCSNICDLLPLVSSTQLHNRFGHIPRTRPTLHHIPTPSNTRPPTIDINRKCIQR